MEHLEQQRIEEFKREHILQAKKTNEHKIVELEITITTKYNELDRLRAENMAFEMYLNEPPSILIQSVTGGGEALGQ